MGQLHIVLIPAMAHGHMIPTLDMAKLFTSRGLNATIIATPSFAHSIEKARESGQDVGLRILQFPPQNSSLPEDILSLDQATTPDLLTSFVEAMSLIQEPVEKLLQELKPDCLVTDTFLPWTVDSAAKLGIPRLAFHGTSCFGLCAIQQMYIHKPYESVSSDSEPFVLPNLPHKLTFFRSQVPPAPNQGESEKGIAKLWQQIREMEGRSYGVIINSFYELESDYADYYKNVMGKKTYHVGPLFLRNDHNGGDGQRSLTTQRGKESCIDEHECLTWLSSKKPDSVVYVCFGSMVTFSRAQLQETAAGLEASGQDFIWVVGKGSKNIEDEMFEERLKGKALIIRGWAPQLMILNHPSVGAFVTHCGWNSTLEGICAGLPMVTWPVFAEQFYNEKMVTDVLRTGVPVGNKKWMKGDVEGVGREEVKAAVHHITVGEAAEDMRLRAKRYKEMAREAVGDGGSSHRGLNGLIEELSVYVPPKH